MLAEIKHAFRNGSKQLTWLDQVTKTAVEDKVCSLYRSRGSAGVFLAMRIENFSNWPLGGSRPLCSSRTTVGMKDDKWVDMLI